MFCTDAWTVLCGIMTFFLKPMFCTDALWRHYLSLEVNILY